MRVCVIDLEMNKPSGSIIQIGAVCYDARQSKVVSTYLETVNPNETIDGYITELTGITQTEVDSCLPLEEVAARFATWAREVGTGKLLAAWGSDCYYLKQRIPAKYYVWNRALDLKQMSTVMQAVLPGKSGGGLATQMARLGIEFEGKQHNALTDAENTVRLLEVYLKAMRLWDRASYLLEEK